MNNDPTALSGVVLSDSFSRYKFSIRTRRRHVERAGNARPFWLDIEPGREALDQLIQTTYFAFADAETFLEVQRSTTKPGVHDEWS